MIMETVHLTFFMFFYKNRDIEIDLFALHLITMLNIKFLNIKVCENELVVH